MFQRFVEGNTVIYVHDAGSLAQLQDSLFRRLMPPVSRQGPARVVWSHLFGQCRVRPPSGKAARRTIPVSGGLPGSGGEEIGESGKEKNGPSRRSRENIPGRNGRWEKELRGRRTCEEVPPPTSSLACLSPLCVDGKAACRVDPRTLLLVPGS